MKTIAGFDFPENPQEAEDWEPVRVRTALARRVLVVAKTRIEGKWSAYCDAVNGENHDDEEAEVYRSGSKLPVNVARLLFPIFVDIPYAV